MMKKRLDALTRLGKLQARMHDLGRWRLSAIEQEQASLVDNLRAVFEALESGDLAYGAQAKLSGRRIRALQRRLDSLACESTHVREKARAHGISARLAEQAAETAARRYRDDRERKELADLIERSIARRNASPT
jgi:predicted GNAT family acetyltransferase